MVTKRKRPPRPLTTEQVEQEIRSRMNIGPHVIKKIAMETDLVSSELELAALLPELADSYVQDKMYEAFLREGVLPRELKDKYASPNVGHDALLALYDRLWIWWEKHSTRSWHEMTWIIERNVRNKITERRAGDAQSMLFLMVAQALDNQVTVQNCHSTWGRGKLRGWYRSRGPQEPEQEQTGEMALKVRVTREQERLIEKRRPNPIEPKKKR